MKIKNKRDLCIALNIHYSPCQKSGLSCCGLGHRWFLQKHRKKMMSIKASEEAVRYAGDYFGQ